MPILLRCHHCTKRLQVDDAFAGSLCRCIHCGALSEVPATAAILLDEPSRPLTPTTKRDKERLTQSAGSLPATGDSSFSREVAPTTAVSEETLMSADVVQPIRSPDPGQFVARLTATGIIVFIAVFAGVRAMRAQPEVPVSQPATQPADGGTMLMKSTAR